MDWEVKTLSRAALGPGPSIEEYSEGVSQSAAYWVRNDIVARLGGGHSGVPVYKLDHLSYRQKPWFRQTPDDQYWDLGPVDAHRIEFGLYSGRRTTGEFEPSRGLRFGASI